VKKLQFMRSFAFGYYRLSDSRQLNKRRWSLGAVNVLTKAAPGLFLGGWNLGVGAGILCVLLCVRSLLLALESRSE